VYVVYGSAGWLGGWVAREWVTLRVQWSNLRRSIEYTPETLVLMAFEGQARIYYYYFIAFESQPTGAGR